MEPGPAKENLPARGVTHSNPHPMQIPKIPCIMCHRVVCDIRDFACRHYGLLERCFHVFCLQCVRQFNICRLRNLGQEEIDGSPSISCPLCALPSTCIVASRSFPLDPEKKSVKFSAFRLATKSIPCPYLKHGVGECLCPAEKHRYMFAAYLEMEDKRVGNEKE